MGNDEDFEKEPIKKSKKKSRYLSFFGRKKSKKKEKEIPNTKLSMSVTDSLSQQSDEQKDELPHFEHAQSDKLDKTKHRKSKFGKKFRAIPQRILIFCQICISVRI